MEPAVSRQSSGASLYHPPHYRSRFGPPLFPRENHPVIPPLCLPVGLRNRQPPKAIMDRSSTSSPSSMPLILTGVRKERPST